MTDSILAAHAQGRTPSSNVEFEAWKNDHQSLLTKFGLYSATKLARIWWGRLVKKVTRPGSDQAQQFLEGMEVFRNTDPGFYFVDEKGIRRSVSTHQSTHAQRQAGSRFLRQGIRNDIARAENLEALDDWSLPYVKKYGDGPLVDQIRRDLQEGQDGAVSS